MPLRGTSKDENRGRPPGEPGSLTGAVSPSFSLAPGPLGTNNCRREHECQSLRYAKAPRAATPDSTRREGLEMDVLVDRCAGLDVHKDTVMAVVRRPTKDGSGREQEVRQYRTFTAALRELRAWLVAERVSQVAMEATGSYWKPVWHVLEAEDGYELLLCNPRHVKNLPGRKTDVSDVAWLAQLAGCGLLRGSFVPSPVMARLRDLTRYAKKLTEERTREVQRLQRVLEDAGIKLDSVASDVMGKSARAMLDALIDGERDPAVLADFAQTRMRVKIPDLRLALEGGFSEHHALLLRMLLDQLDDLSAAVRRVAAPVVGEVAPFTRAVELLGTIPGVGPRTAWVLLAESGSPGALRHRGPLRTVRAPPRRTRLKQAARALRVEVPASCVGGRAARGGRRRGSSGFGSHPSCPSRRGGRGVRRRSPCVPRPATSVPSPRGTGVGRG